MRATGTVGLQPVPCSGARDYSGPPGPPRGAPQHHLQALVVVTGLALRLHAAVCSLLPTGPGAAHPGSSHNALHTGQPGVGLGCWAQCPSRRNRSRPAPLFAPGRGTREALHQGWGCGGEELCCSPGGGPAPSPACHWAVLDSPGQGLTGAPQLKHQQAPPTHYAAGVDASLSPVLWAGTAVCALAPTTGARAASEGHGPQYPPAGQADAGPTHVRSPHAAFRKVTPTGDSAGLPPVRETSRLRRASRRPRTQGRTPTSPKSNTLPLRWRDTLTAKPGTH